MTNKYWLGEKRKTFIAFCTSKLNEKFTWWSLETEWWRSQATGRRKAKKTPWRKQHMNRTSNWAASKGTKVTISQNEKKQHWSRENKYMVRTWWVTLTAQNTWWIWKEPGLFVYLCKIYTQLHMYICTHRHYCTYVYATSTQLPSGCKQKMLQLCKNLQFCVWLPRRNGREIQTNAQTAQTQQGFHPQGHFSPASECSQLICWD